MDVEGRVKMDEIGKIRKRSECVQGYVEMGRGG